jgi:hypothetical protein
MTVPRRIPRSQRIGVLDPLGRNATRHVPQTRLWAARLLHRTTVHHLITCPDCRAEALCLTGEALWQATDEAERLLAYGRLGCGC